MSAPPVALRRSARNSAKRPSPTAETTAPAEPEAAAPAPKKKRTTPAAEKKAEKKAPAVKKAAAAVKKAVAAVVAATAAPATEEKPAATAGADEEPAAAAPADAAPVAAVAELKEGDSIPDDLPEIQTHTGETTTLTALIAAAEKGVVIFSYPKASTPGCTAQACAFRDSTSQFSTLGYAIYGLSGDNPSANEKFYAKQNLADIKLLCDPKYELHARLGVKKAGVPKGTIRSVVVIRKGVNGAKATVVKRSPAKPAGSVDIALKAINAAATEKKDEDAEMNN